MQLRSLTSLLFLFFSTFSSGRSVLPATAARELRQTKTACVFTKNARLLRGNARDDRRHHKAQLQSARLGPEARNGAELQGAMRKVISKCGFRTVSVAREDKKNIPVAPEDTRG